MSNLVLAIASNSRYQYSYSYGTVASYLRFWVLNISFSSSFQDLEQRHNTILQMYGEKAEEAEELRLDLEDVKNMYKTQIDELLKNQK